MIKKRTLLSWSSGKDSAWTLYQLQQQPDVELVALITSFNEAFDRVAMHGVRHELVKAQAEAVGLPLIAVPLPWPCTNEDYERIMATALTSAAEQLSATHIAFGDLYLEDVRRYREKQVEPLGLEPFFPIWGTPTQALAHRMIELGLKAQLTCLNPKQAPADLAGASFDLDFLEALPDTVDPCGESGEFHTFAWDGPMFNQHIPIQVGETIERDGFLFTDISLATPRANTNYSL